MNHSFQLYSARNFTPWDAVFKTVKSLGYQHVEGFGTLYEDVEATRAMLDAHTLSMPSAHFSLDALENDFEATIAIAKTLGISNVFCPHIGPNERATDLAGWQAFAHRLSAIGNKVVDQGLQFGWHNHDFEFETCADGSIPMRVILETASEIDWEMDVAWTVRAGSDPLPWLEEFGSRVTAVHVKDIAAAGECGDEDGWADVGFGTMQWEKLVPTIVAKTKASLYIAEHDNPNDFDRFAKRSIASLQSYT